MIFSSQKKLEKIGQSWYLTKNLFTLVKWVGYNTIWWFQKKKNVDFTYFLVYIPLKSLNLIEENSTCCSKTAQIAQVLPIYLSGSDYSHSVYDHQEEKVKP